ncbi:pilus assembly PilX family protein [Massilia glaciei]|uniref:Type 4 fimbrial biogenesis protein PilX N-terminal domain-containing protein n=1 Tax=Massilia glaciei TaxID=1524097 RepID=A0A2U2HE42_9BURK|nr:hypothetical protein [Massilia glaciei]PWF41594.1 hypothetical protein C7C56_024530 [Massilia glaciei]
MNGHPRPPRPQRQRGITLITALIMLVLLTMLALTSFNLGKSNLQVVANMQQRDEAIAAARETLEEVISSPNFTDDPAAALAATCGPANQRCVDSNGDGTADVNVVLAPTPVCAKVQAIKNNDLTLGVADDDKCSNGNLMTGIQGSNTGNSDCSDTTWDITAVATDVLTEAQVSVTQGVAVRVDNNVVENFCP